MKRKILAIFLFAMLAMNVCSCNYAPENEISEETTEEITSSETNNNEVSEETTEEIISSETSDIESSETDDIQDTTDTDIDYKEYSTQELVEELKLPSIFASVLKNETMVCCWDENGYLKDYIISPIYFAFVSSIDLDGNGIKDVVVLEVNDTVIILKEHEGTVYAWLYGHTALYNLRVNGTYDWSENVADTFMYGSSKLQFNGAEINPVELDRIENNEKFYINETEVSYEEYVAYVDNQDLAEEAATYDWKPDF